MSLFLRVQLQSARSSGAGDQKLRIVMWKPNKPEDVAYVTELLDAGTIAPVIERSYPLDEVPEAFRRLEFGAVLGKVAISMWRRSPTWDGWRHQADGSAGWGRMAADPAALRT